MTMSSNVPHPTATSPTNPATTLGGQRRSLARIMDILGGGDAPTQFGEQYIFVTPRMETGDPRYSWVNQTVFIGEGRVLPGPRIEFRVYRVASGEGLNACIGSPAAKALWARSQTQPFRTQPSTSDTTVTCAGARTGGHAFIPRNPGSAAHDCSRMDQQPPFRRSSARWRKRRRV
jgi:hypothetical protein